jgi:hypothetical protein
VLLGLLEVQKVLVHDPGTRRSLTGAVYYQGDDFFLCTSLSILK